MFKPKKRMRVAAASFALFFGATTALVACGNEPDDNTVANLLPSNTIGFMSAAISPSNKQKLSMFALQKHFPSKVQTDKADDVRDKLLAELFKDNKSNLNYETDIKPWLGSEAAMAVLPSYTNDHVPVVVLAAKQTDKDKAKAALDKAKEKENTYRFIGDYVFFVDEEQIEKENATKALDDIEALNKSDKNSLQKNKRFQDNIDQLHGEHLVIGWVDTPVAAREGIAYAKANPSAGAFQQFNEVGTEVSGASYQPGSASVKPVQADSTSALLGMSALGGLDALDQKQKDDAYNKIQTSADEVGSFSFEFYATTDSFVMEGVTEKEPKDTPAGTDKKIFNSLPNDTLGAFTVSEFGKTLQDALAEYEKDENSSAYAEVKPSVDKLVGALGNEGVGFLHNGDPLVGGAVFELKDANAAQSAIDELLNKIKPSGLIAVTDYSVPGGKAYDIQQQTTGQGDFNFDDSGNFNYVPGKTEVTGPHYYIGIANNRLSITNDGQQLKAALAGDGQLGSQAPVKKALTDQTVVFGSFYVNVDQAVQLAQKQGAKLTGDEGDWWKSLDVFGTQSWVKDGHYHAELRVGLK
jgi:hypothetical protein